MTQPEHVAAVRQTLARLLAGEAVTVVQDPSAETASFNLRDRLLTLPDWQVTETTYSMLLCHEVGHARFTPATLTETIRADWPDYQPETHGPLINIFEDLRIDRAIQHHYPGAVRTYAAAYADLHAAGILTTPPATAPLPLRVLARSRTTPGVVITAAEAATAAEMAAPRDFAHVVALARRWAERAPAQPPTPTPGADAQPGTPGDACTPADSTTPAADADNAANADDVSATSTPNVPDAPASGDTVTSDSDTVTPASDTVTGDGDPLDGQRDPLADYLRAQTPPPADTGHVQTYVLDRLPAPIVTALRDLPSDADTARLLADWDVNPCRTGLETQWRTCRADAALMAATFRVKVNARTLRHAGRRDEGRLDPRRLHAYRYTDRLFTTLQAQPKGTSHGLLLAVDLSDSMRTALGAGTAQAGPILTQVVTLVEFCRALRLPYRVVGFTGEHDTRGASRTTGAVQPLSSTYLTEFRQLDLFASTDTAAQHAAALHALGAWWAGITHNVTASGVFSPDWARLGVTPLLDALVLLPTWARSLGAVDRPFVVLLTDGEPSNMADWTAATVADPTAHATYRGSAPSGYAHEHWDTPLWHALLARVRAQTGAVLHNHFLPLYEQTLAQLARKASVRTGRPVADPKGQAALLLPDIGGFDLLIVHNPDVALPSRPNPRAATRGYRPPATRAARLQALSQTLASRADRALLATLATSLAESAARPAA